MGNGEKNNGRVLVPEELRINGYIGEIYGKHLEETDTFNIYSPGMMESYTDYDHLGEIKAEGIKSEDTNPDISKNGNLSMSKDTSPDESTSDTKELYGKKLTGQRNGDEIVFEYNGKTYKTEYYNLLQKVFSRNTGIFESDIMRRKCAVIAGCGSVGSLVSLELARAGTGRFVLIDNDVFEYHNICRHQCSVQDVGKKKTTALKERILQINPEAEVICQPHIFERVPKEIFDENCMQGDSVIIGCADDRAADVYANAIAAGYGVPFISIGCWERAAAGEVFYWLPGSDMPCYECAIGNSSDVSGRNSVNRRHYTTEDISEDLDFEPGISADINFVTTVGVKLALDILNIGNERYTPRVLGHLKQYTLICNTNNPKIGGEAVEIFYKPLMITDSLVVSHCAGCPPCRHEEDR